MISSIYKDQLPADIEFLLKKVIDRAIQVNPTPCLFFRADDIGVPSENFDRMMQLFLKYKMPLCLAVVPTWLTRPRWDTMKPYRDQGGDLFCWHMHGYQHENHETEGKKQEFGPSRSTPDIEKELKNGAARLSKIMGDCFFPVFTPPWNRCSQQTLDLLYKLDFKAVSRSCGATPHSPAKLKDICVQVDLHTRKEALAQDGWTSFLNEMEKGLCSQACGVMLHHMRMNETAFLFLDLFLKIISQDSRIEKVSYTGLA